MQVKGFSNDERRQVNEWGGVGWGWVGSYCLFSDVIGDRLGLGAG